MPADRYYCPQEFYEQGTIFLENVEFHHLINVMRNEVGDHVELINGRGQLAKARIKKLEKKRGVLEVDSLFTATTLETPLILALGIPRLPKLEIILEKATELGMTEIWLFPAAHTEKKQFSPNQLDRLQTILISAIKQCGRLFLPEIIMMPSLTQWQQFPFPAYFGETTDQAPLFRKVWEKQPANKGSIFCIGPESGFTDPEISILKALGASGVSLNKNILRTETAAIAAISLISHWQQQ